MYFLEALCLSSEHFIHLQRLSTTLLEALSNIQLTSLSSPKSDGRPILSPKQPRKHIEKDEFWRLSSHLKRPLSPPSQRRNLGPIPEPEIVTRMSMSGASPRKKNPRQIDLRKRNIRNMLTNWLSVYSCKTCLITLSSVAALTALEIDHSVFGINQLEPMLTNQLHSLLF